jgi:hypothetical protein
MISIAHIINPVKAQEGSELFIAQPIVFEATAKSKSICKWDVDVKLFSAQYEEDSEVVPDYLQKTANLEKCNSNQWQEKTAADKRYSATIISNHQLRNI